MDGFAKAVRGFEVANNGFDFVLFHDAIYIKKEVLMTAVDSAPEVSPCYSKSSRRLSERILLAGFSSISMNLCLSLTMVLILCFKL